ncbi:hypothetical protein RclHR1_10980007 [Rhizophagus clarus]|uniref:Uncharacterized protein n=1 Tax=Rhizophagus clarus TaxID=94130 RepID=A0A2Z6Q4J0_9GLOM|nr:hypothetical protein RclHR1_10980007 [Rhizophagus clarus]
MSVTTEGSEELSVPVTRETRQASKINQICTKIDEILTQNRNQTLIKITLPELHECNNEYVKQAVFNKYHAEMVGEDLFIKIDGGNKTRIQFKLNSSADTYNPNWFVTQGTDCVMMGRNYKPDVGIWFNHPNFNQRQTPIASTCPPPDVYIEIFFNRDPDRGFAFEKLDAIQQNNLNIEFIGIALPSSQGPFRQNPNPGVASVPSTPLNPPNVRPARAPYFVYWNGTNLAYYKIDWNEHLVLLCGWTMELNIVLDTISMP